MKKIFLLLFLVFFINNARSQEFDTAQFLLKLSKNKSIGCLFYPNMLETERSSIVAILELKKYNFFNEGQNLLISMTPSVDLDIKELKKNQVEIYKKLSDPNQAINNDIISKQLQILSRLTNSCK